MKRLLEVKNLEYSYGASKVVKGISFYVDEGEIVTLIGSNGAGKTTTLQTISGLTDPHGCKGEIFFDGKPIHRMAGHKIAAKGLIQVLEGRHVFPKLTVEENLYTGAYLRKDKAAVRKDVDSMYELFPRLLERRTSLGTNLSGGEQQMLAIARAYMGKPRMILMDEPSLGLAPLIIKEIFESIKRLNKEGMTILFVEQNSKIALNTASRGYVLQTGEVVLEDTCEKLLQNDDIRKAYLGES